MNIVTISHEFGAGSSEVAQKLAAALSWELLDRELLHQAAQVENVPDAELERLDETALTLVDRLSRHPPHARYLHGLKLAVAAAADRGNVVLVGRGARQLLGERPAAFHVRLVAPKPWRAQRMAALEGRSLEESLARCTEQDRIRDRFFRYFFNADTARPAEYDLVVNSGRVPRDDVVALVAAVVRGSAAPPPVSGESRRIMTLARELGAGEHGLPPTLGRRLGMKVYDRELLGRQAVRLGVPESEIEKIDERAAGIVQRLLPSGIYQRYLDAMRDIMHELAASGNAILVGRGGCRLLRDEAIAFHIRLVSPMAVRVRRVMEYHWVQEGVAKHLIAESDARRSNFYASSFAADWSSPLEYNMTVNTGRLGPAAVDVIALAAQRHWSK